MMRANVEPLSQEHDTAYYMERIQRLPYYENQIYDSPIATNFPTLHLDQNPAPGAPQLASTFTAPVVYRSETSSYQDNIYDLPEDSLSQAMNAKQRFTAGSSPRVQKAEDDITSSYVQDLEHWLSQPAVIPTSQPVISTPTLPISMDDEFERFMSSRTMARPSSSNEASIPTSSGSARSHTVSNLPMKSMVDDENLQF